jgi:uncharacterized protein YkwD
MNPRFQRLISFAVAVVFTVPLSAFDESRRVQRTDLRQLADDLSRALGSGDVEIEGVEHTTNAFDDAIIAAMNRERAAHGLRPLRLNDQLTLAAEDRTRDMLAKHYFDHVSPDGVDPFKWAERRGYDYREIGENLAVGYGSAAAVVDGWMHSPGHRANILGAHFGDVGIAVAASPVRGYGAPLVVALYGTR